MEIPREFGDFRLEKELGQGGMGIVYRAIQKTLQRPVAIKFLPMAYDPELRDRFLLEAQTAAKINHPNVVNIYSFGIVEDMPYFVMECIEGTDLREVIRNYRTYTFNQLIKLALQMAEALDSAHELGIIHRDIKPANIMITSRGYIKVMDFGLAKTKSHFASLTQSGDILGTPYYMSPEQARGEATIDERADLYSLGVVLFEMVTGLRPFRGDSSHVILYKHIYEPPCNPSDLTTNLPRPLENIILKCMEKEPDQRFSSARLIMEALKKLADFGTRPLSVEDFPTMISSSSEDETVEEEIPDLLLPEDNKKKEDINGFLHNVLDNQTLVEKSETEAPPMDTSPFSVQPPAQLTPPPVQPVQPPAQSPRPSTPIQSSQDDTRRKKPISQELQKLQRQAHKDTLVRKKKKNYLKTYLFFFLNKVVFLGLVLSLMGFLSLFLYRTWQGEREKVAKEKIQEFTEKIKSPFDLSINGQPVGEGPLALDMAGMSNLKISGRFDGRVSQSAIGATWGESPLSKGQIFPKKGDLFTISMAEVPKKPGQYTLTLVHSGEIPPSVLGSLGDPDKKYPFSKKRKISLVLAPLLLKSPRNRGVYLANRLLIQGKTAGKAILRVFQIKKGTPPLLETTANLRGGPFAEFLSLKERGLMTLKIEFQIRGKTYGFRREIFLGASPISLQILAKRGQAIAPLSGVKVRCFTSRGTSFNLITNRRGKGQIPTFPSDFQKVMFQLDGREIFIPMVLDFSDRKEIQVKIPLSKVTLLVKNPSKIPKILHLENERGRWIRSLGKTDKEGKLVAWLYPGRYSFFSDSQSFYTAKKLVSIKKGDTTVELAPLKASSEEKFLLIPSFQLTVYSHLFSGPALYLFLIGLGLSLYLLRRSTSRRR